MNEHSDKRRFVGRPSFTEAESQALEAFRKECKYIVLSRDAPAPLWEQLYNQLETLILGGRLAPHSRLPTEPVLCDIFQVSKPVVRHAISSLANKGLVVKLPRKGMFVGERPKESGFISSNVSLFDDMMARGAKIDTRTYDFMVGPADFDERQGLGLSENDKVIRITRVFRIDNRAITHSVMSFPASRLPGLTRETIRGKSIHGVIRENFGLRIVRAERWLGAELPPQSVLERMDLPSNHPLIAIESVGYEQDGTRLEYYRAFYNSSVARIRIGVSD